MSRTVVFVGVVALAIAAPVSAAFITSDPTLPPVGGEYRSAQDVHARYVAGSTEILLEEIRHFGFANIIRTPCGPNCEQEQFDSQVAGIVIVNNNNLGEVLLTGPVQTRVLNYNTKGNPIQTEMLALSLVSVAPFMIRESPTLPSLGETKVTDLGAGLFRIDSFFDVFTELSLDKGVTWIPDSNGPVRVTLQAPVPEPATWIGVAAGMLLLRKKRGS